MTVNGTIVERLEPLLGLCLGGCSPVEPRYAVVQHVRLWMPLLFSPVSDRQTHLLLRMFSEMKHGCRDTYFLPLIKKACLLREYWIKHGYQQCMLRQMPVPAFANHQLNCQHKYYNAIFKVYDFCGCLYSISAANWLWLHKPALFQYRITGNIFIIYWIATQCLLVFHRLLRSAIYFFDSLENFMHNE